MVGKILDTGSIFESNDRNVIHLSMFDVEYYDCVTSLLHYRSIIITSRHAVLGVAKHNVRPNDICNVFAVGHNVGSYINSYLGINPRIYDNVHHLIQDLICYNAERPILYLRGVNVSQNLKKDLFPKYCLEEIIVYNAKACTMIPDNILKMLSNGNIEEIRFYSSRSYNIFCNLTQDIKFDAKLKFVPHGLLSKIISYK